MESICRCCGASDLSAVAYFADQPIASHFKRAANEADQLFDLRVLGCGDCGLVQLEKIPLLGTLRPRFDWLRYNEPEAHLDDVAQVLSGLCDPSLPVLGLTYKDDTLLSRMSGRGFSDARRNLSGNVFAGASGPWGIETVADWLGRGDAEFAARGAGVVVARHVLEHAEVPAAAIRTMLNWLDAKGLLMVEVPGCREALERGIPELLWEEHASYFTEATLKRLLENSGAEILHFGEHVYPFENSLVAIVRRATCDQAGKSSDDPSLAARFGAQVRERVALVARGLKQRNAKGKRTVVFGAGHLSCAFLSLSATSEFVDCVIDDMPQKRGMFLAGTSVPILATAELSPHPAGLCLMAVHPSSEEKVYQRLAPLRQAGWEVASIFPASKYGIRWS